MPIGERCLLTIKALASVSPSNCRRVGWFMYNTESLVEPEKWVTYIDTIIQFYRNTSTPLTIRHKYCETLKD